MITNTAKNIVFCVTESKTPILNSQMSANSCSTRISDCSSDWRSAQKKIVPYSNICVDSCSSTSYIYEYLGKCYSKCPNGTASNNSDNYICYNCHSDCKECGLCSFILFIMSRFK